MNEVDPANDIADFVRQLTEHQGDLWAFIIAQLPGSPDVADILQKTNLTIWTKQKDFTPGTNFRAWAFTIARYEVLAHLKRHKRSNWLVFDDELIETIASEVETHIPASNHRLQALETCMAKLKPNHQELLKYRYRGEGGLASHAKREGRSVSSLSVTLYRIRTTLRKCIQAELNPIPAKGGTV